LRIDSLITFIHDIKKRNIMKYLLSVRMSVEKGNAAIKDPQFGHKINEIITGLKADAVYFSTIRGQRGFFAILDINDPSEIPLLCEPLFLWLNADVELNPLMKPEDLAKAGPGIGAAVQKWG